MPKRKKKQTGLENTEMGTEQKITLGPASAKTNPGGPPPQVEVEDEPLGGETVLDTDGDQPLMSTESGDSWDYQADPQVREVLEETEREDNGGEMMANSLRTNRPESPVLTGGDVDAEWENAEEGGEETVGGSSPTPDQDRVDELGEAAGLVYQDGEPLNTEEKLDKRDRERWELNPASQE
jgi:hypothetical protein